MTDATETSMGRVQKIHFVGIGGAGMSGIAEILHNLGYVISGSDIRENSVTRQLRKLGISVQQGHSAGQVDGSDVVVISGAVAADNPEIQAARRLRIPVIPRAEMLAEIMRFRYGIAVAGTHGKTTTTSLIASLLAEGGLDPTYVIGGRLNSIGSNAKLGSSRYLVAEADESDASFLHLQPVMAVLTNIDADHLATYAGDFSRLRHTFLEFLQRLPFYGLAVLCMDDEGVREILPDMTRPFVTYGIDRPADFSAADIRFNQGCSSFSVSAPGKADWLQIKLNLPGRHNVLNALGAIAVAADLGVADSSIMRAMCDFQGIARRCDVKGDLQVDNRRILLIDDYAHHPSEIRATLDAVNSGWPDRRVVVIFQPHRYTRTRDLFDEFCETLCSPEVLLLFHIYSAGEEPLPGIDSYSLCDGISQRGGEKPVLVENRDDLVPVLSELLQDEDILLIMGAGDIGTLAGELVSRYGMSVH